MEAYKSFAYVYDLLMDDIPYDDWANYIIEIWKKFNIEPKLVLDIGCGTGNLTLRLRRKGYDMIGLDISEDMLMIAKSKDNETLYLCQDMCEFELYGTVDSIICIFDSINYILEDEKILNMFKLVKNYLNPGGIFIFDLNTEYKFKEILDNNSFSIVKDEVTCIWDHIYDEGVLEYFVTLFTKKEGDLYQRSEEFHYQKSYSTEKIKKFLGLADLNLLGIFDAFTFDTPNSESERIYFVISKS